MHAEIKNDLLSQKCLAMAGDNHYSRVAQFRACLWPCVDRWASGQEAGQPPKEVISLFLAHAIGSRRRTGAPRSPRGTRLKATTERAFLVLPAQNAGSPKRLVLLAGRAERDLNSLIRTKAAIDVMLARASPPERITGGSSGGCAAMPDRERTGDDSTHPRIPQAAHG